MKTKLWFLPVVLCASISLVNAPAASAAVWLPATGGSWALGTNWDTGTVPNAVGATATFANNATANRTITNDSGTPGFTVGNISFAISSAFNNSLTTGTANSKLTLDNGGAGVTLLTTGNGTGNNSISVPLVFADAVTAEVDQVTSSSVAGSLNLTATITGTGAFIKQGDGLATFGTGLKTYSGPTVINGGRMRISNMAQPSATASFTINAGGQIDLIPGGAAGVQTFTFGTGPLNLNGFGAVSGPFASLPGAIRNDRGTGTGGVFSPIITNNVVLQSDSLVHVQAIAGTANNLTPDGFLTFSGTVSGPGSLSLTAPVVSDFDQGSLILTGSNTYAGGTFVNGGILNVNSDAALGAPAAPLILNGSPFSGSFLRAALRASGPVTTNARTITVGGQGNTVGATIDTNGNPITFGVGSTVTGTRLTKIGAGRLTLAGTQTYDTLDTEAGRTDLASALGTGTSTLIANAETNIAANQQLAALLIGGGATVTLSSALPPAPDFGENADALATAAPVQGIPEPATVTLLLLSTTALLGISRRGHRGAGRKHLDGGSRLLAAFLDRGETRLFAESRSFPLSPFCFGHGRVVGVQGGVEGEEGGEAADVFGEVERFVGGERAAEEDGFAVAEPFLEHLITAEGLDVGHAAALALRRMAPGPLPVPGCSSSVYLSERNRWGTRMARSAGGAGERSGGRSRSGKSTLCPQRISKTRRPTISASSDGTALPTWRWTARRSPTISTLSGKVWRRASSRIESRRFFQWKGPVAGPG